ncbi:glutamate-1-semialdehyde 2,1-aminomutase [Desulfovermiculus halophilus]|uniref:glutamate-1-semialdehyde 2,1-aminomutase n=1 Tax=Desulfovermiculus halophilus TaxID=339722 RepID=UPI000485EFF4|nr:glutamate-1-semialdehyde 2,1-aminomutase [Desulfovermiculus halophilus]
MNTSAELFSKAQKLIPGGVNSPVRACRSVHADPLFIRQGKGSHIYSEDGQEFIDYVMSWGPLLLGHCREEVVQAAHKAVDLGASFGAPCRDEISLAQLIVDALPGVDMVRLVNSGTEATMTALRLARAATGRSKVLKFVGCYHGHVDSLLAQAGSGLATLSLPGTPGVPEHTVQDTLLAPYNDLQAVQDIFARHGSDICAVIVEPVAGNMGCVPPDADFLPGLRRITQEHGSLLIFDEVISGFRVDYGGAQTKYGVTPDLTCLGKIIGGGFPVGAFGGKKEVMEHLAPCGDTYQAGTLAGNPVAMAAGTATLSLLRQSDYNSLADWTQRLAEELAGILTSKGVPISVNCVGSIFTLFFTSTPVKDFETAKTVDTESFAHFYRHMRSQGIYLAPSSFECTFTSFAHTEQDFEQTLEAARKVSFPNL